MTNDVFIVRTHKKNKTQNKNKKVSHVTRDTGQTWKPSFSIMFRFTVEPQLLSPSLKSTIFDGAILIFETLSAILISGYK